jgi:thiol-disulfide isomerase/thioredoxin
VKRHSDTVGESCENKNALKVDSWISYICIDQSIEMSIRIEYIGATWCAPCRIAKPLVSILAHKFACSLEEHDYDEMEEEQRSTIMKLPTVRIWKDSVLVKEITTQHADMLEIWLKSNVRVNTDEDF